jgi:hypothetical protein
MRELAFELLIRLSKPLAALLAGVVVWVLATGPGGAAPSAELAILCWLAGAGFIVLVSEGPI